MGEQVRRTRVWSWAQPSWRAWGSWDVLRLDNVTASRAQLQNSARSRFSLSLKKRDFLHSSGARHFAQCFLRDRFSHIASLGRADEHVQRVVYVCVRLCFGRAVFMRKIKCSNQVLFACMWSAFPFLSYVVGRFCVNWVWISSSRVCCYVHWL